MPPAKKERDRGASPGAPSLSVVSDRSRMNVKAALYPRVA